uniref:ubiquitinyl hydrolase 1 n=1 Tax=Peronospora matthiolae TaxID=2874970 RepID=A0AAV1V4W0_9STRA
MLFLYFAQNRPSRVIRAHFLSPLLSEARQFMHRYLSATGARLDVFEQPFHRKVDLDLRRLEFVRDTLAELKRSGGIQVVAPEHRMSLELKRLESGNDDPAVEILDAILDSNQFVDVLDECDAILHHKYHLVYAVGTPIPLGSGMERWTVTEAVLRVVANQTASSRVRKVLQAAHVSCFSPDYVTRLGSYDGTRLNTLVESTKLMRHKLKEALVLDLIDEAPFELMWLNTFGGNAARPSIVTAITDSTVSLQEALGDGLAKITPFVAQLLAMRGLVAFGVLEHCLEKRYRVDFGLPVCEFSHPDVCIVLTLLGYYHGGLTKEEVRDAFKVLLRLDISEQEHQYDRWFVSVEPGLTDTDRVALCNVRHISLADSRQFETLCRVYKYCMEAINFFLNTCVFPNDTQQYPQRLSRTAWNLAAGDCTIGFSGTNDNHRLLPLSVAQREPNEPSLLGTNGKMIDKIIRVTHSYEVINPSPRRGLIPWQSVLLFAIDKKAQALIDTGALLAGVANDGAADFVLKQADFAFAGVTFYDSRKEHNCWMIAEKARGIKLPLKKSSMLEKETFVIFDEARSRGSDMKLLPDAVAVLTLGPKLTKDKLMQGAGRMRQPGCNQTLWIASFDEVAQSVLQTSGKHALSRVSVIDVLNWVMDNTKAEATQLNPNKELVDENWSLETMYQEKLHVDKIAKIIDSKAHLDSKLSADAVVDEICCRGFVYGLDDEVCVTSHTDECERELQIEEEIIQEREVEVMKCVPIEEKVWKYEKILCARSVKDLNGVVQVVEMTDFIGQSVIPKEMTSLAWSSSRIFGTVNFFTTIGTCNTQTSAEQMNAFLRMIDVVLVFRNGQVLLLSECEADHILELLWSARGRKHCNFRFINLAFARESLARGGTITKFRDVHLALGQQLDQELPLLSTIACHVFTGETMMAKEQRAKVEQAFRDLLRPLAQRETTLSNFVTSRGNSHKWMRSFLHELCRRMDLEYCTNKRVLRCSACGSKRQKV